MAGMTCIKGGAEINPLELMDGLLDAASPKGNTDAFVIHPITDDKNTPRVEFVPRGTYPEIGQGEVAEAGPLSDEEALEIAGRIALILARIQPELSLVQ